MGILVTKGVMTQDQANALVPQIVAAIMGIATVGVIYWKKSQHSSDAVVAVVKQNPDIVAVAVRSDLKVASAAVSAVNSAAIPGVKVVSDTSPSAQVVVDNKGNVKLDPAQPYQPKPKETPL